jgi:hypothetical protein
MFASFSEYNSEMSVKAYIVVFWTALLLEHFSCTTEEQEEVWSEPDTYLDAYTDSHVSPDFQTSSLFPVKTHGISFPYYSSPGPNFHSHYDSSSGPTGPNSPSGPSAYGVTFSPIYREPYEAPDNGFKGLPADLDFATLCKILLKVLIFKMIVKFIAVICVLLFLPKLEPGGSSAGNRKLLFSKDGGLRFIALKYTLYLIWGGGGRN